MSEHKFITAFKGSASAYNLMESIGDKVKDAAVSVDFSYENYKSFAQWYEQFADMRTVNQNEMLAEAMRKALDIGPSFLVTDDEIFLFVSGAFDAESITAQVKGRVLDARKAAEPTDELERYLGENRIVITNGFHQFFINSRGETVYVDEEGVYVPYNTKTVEAIRQIDLVNAEEEDVARWEEVLGPFEKWSLGKTLDDDIAAAPASPSA